MPVSNKVNPTNKSYELDIVWPEATEIQGRLKIIQCIGLFYGSRHPCRTSLVNIQFTREKGGYIYKTPLVWTSCLVIHGKYTNALVYVKGCLDICKPYFSVHNAIVDIHLIYQLLYIFIHIDATTTSTEALTTTTEQEIEETTTTISEDTTTTKRDKNEHTVTEKMDPTIGVNKRAVESVRQSNARVANIRSIGESDIFNNSANLCPNHLLLLLFALCLIVCLWMYDVIIMSPITLCSNLWPKLHKN